MQQNSEVMNRCHSHKLLSKCTPPRNWCNVYFIHSNCCNNDKHVEIYVDEWSLSDLGVRFMTHDTQKIPMSSLQRPPYQIITWEIKKIHQCFKNVKSLKLTNLTHFPWIHVYVYINIFKYTYIYYMISQQELYSSQREATTCISSGHSVISE